MDFKQLTFADKEIFDFYFKKFNPEISEYTFTNLYVFLDSRQIEYCIYQNTLILYAISDNTRFFLPPIGENLENAYIFIKNKMNEMSINCLKLIPKSHLTIVSKVFNKENIVEDRNNFDYVYESSKLGSLTSRKFSGKRNFINRFEKNYKFVVLPYNKNHYNQCINLINKWLSFHPDDLSVRNECYSIQKLLQQYESLDATGIVMLVDEKIVAFSFGEKLNNDTFVVHYEKADTDIVGAYQMINKMFVQENILPLYKYVNREQDLGHDNIRQAKMSYYPDKFIEKFQIQIEK